jgi:2'-5' RNA ligase
MNKQLRLFVGIFPSRSTQEQLNKEAENLSEKLQTKVRILAPEILHLTVKFIGNVDETQLSALTAAFLKATGNLPSASLQIRQFMLFPSCRKPRVVAAQIERSPELNYIFQ